VIAVDAPMSQPWDDRYANPSEVFTMHGPNVEMRAIWHPVITVRDGDDLTPLLDRLEPFTVVKDTAP